MAIQLGDIKFFVAGSGLGGAISSGEVPSTLNALFDIISAQDGTEGGVEYRGLYVKNETSGTNALINGGITLTSGSGDMFTDIEIALAVEGVDAQMEELADEDSAPAGGVIFSGLNDKLDFPVYLEKGSYIGVWIKRIVTSGSSAINDSCTLAVTGETGA
jgi:hypothetical protein